MYAPYIFSYHNVAYRQLKVKSYLILWDSFYSMLYMNSNAVNEIISPKKTKIMLNHHLFFDRRSHKLAGITIKYLETVSFIYNTPGKKVVDR
jgi:hypothetical protein